MFSFQSGGKNTFANELRTIIPQSTSIQIAVAWTRASGLDLIWDEVCQVLEDGGQLALVTGVDSGNTSAEALRALVGLQKKYTKAKCFVRHQENASLFHVKLYAFDLGAHRAIHTGSSNLTAAGLHSNEELMVKIDVEKHSATEESFLKTWGKIIEVHPKFVRPLTASFCEDLIARGYACNESASRPSDQKRSNALKRKKPLFGTSSPGRPPFRGSVPLIQEKGPAKTVSKNVSNQTQVAPPSPTISEIHEGAAIADDWSRISILLLRSRGTQSQLPKAVFEAIKRKLGQSNMLESCEVRDRSSGGSRRISPVGKGNTYKLETGLAEDVDLVAKFDAYDGGVQVEFFDSSDGEGKRIFSYLTAGEKLDPPQTINVKPHVEKATLYRVD